MTYVVFASLATLLYFGSGAPAQIVRGYRLGEGRRNAGWWMTALPLWTLQIVWHCVPAAIVYLIGLLVYYFAFAH